MKINATERPLTAAVDLVFAIPGEQYIDGLELLLNDPVVAQWLGGTRTRDAIRSAVADERNHWETNGFGPWVALDPATNVVIGRGGLRRAEVLGRAEVELFYAVAPPAWKRGIATEISRRALELAFLKASLESVVSFTTERNQASQRVLEKLGFTKGATFEHAGLLHRLCRVTKGEFMGRHPR